MDAPPWIKPNGLADLTLQSAMRRHIAMVLDYCDGERIWAAEELGVDQSTLYRWLKADGQREPRLANMGRRNK